MKGFLVAVSTLLGLIAGILAFVLLEQTSIRSDLRSDREQLLNELKEARNRIGNLESENKKIASDLEAQRRANAEAEEAKSEAAKPKPTPKNTNHTVAASSQPRSYKVRTYLDGDYLGKAWMVLQKTSMTNQTGQATYEPVVVLTPELRDHVVVYKTNVIERVERPARPQPIYNNYNQRYYNSYAAAAAAAIVRGKRGGKGDTPPNGSNQGPSPKPQPHAARPRSSSPWAPWPQTGENIRKQQQQEAAQAVSRDGTIWTQPLKTRSAQIETRRVPRFNNRDNR